MEKPLAYRMRPRELSEVVGQTHLLGPGKIIRRMVEAKLLSSMILYGPPGTGKTSIASAIAGSTHYAFRSLNAATDSKKDLQVVAEEGKMSGGVVLLLDEVHRLDKTKQDFLLPFLENGKIILIGATTENPYFSINPAIRSRLQIFEVKPLTAAEILPALKRALKDPERGLGKEHAELPPAGLAFLAERSGGDLRSALNALELAVKSTAPAADGTRHVTITDLEESLQQKTFAFDKDGDAHYDLISAFQKSIRGSDVDAALHYLARLLAGGDLKSVTRRLLVIAYEDIGLGNPNACARTVQAVTAAERLGLPEGRIPLADAVIDLALSPKSNSGIASFAAAEKDLAAGSAGEIPRFLQDAHYSGAKALGRGQEYRYPHDDPRGWVAQEYLPKGLRGKHYYQAKTTGKYEAALKARYEQLQKWKHDSEKNVSKK